MSVGIPQIDADHKHFIVLINQLNKAIRERMPQEDIRQVLQLIIVDAEQHFAREERYFAEWHYPDVENHTKLHQQALNTLRDIMAASVAYGFDAEWIAAGLKIKQTLIEHILEEDSKYAQFYVELCQK